MGESRRNHLDERVKLKELAAKVFPRGRGRTVKDYREALEMARGYPAVAAELLGVGPSAVTQMVKRHPSLKKFYEDLKADRNTRNVDMAEEKLRKALEDGQAWAVRYILDNHGAERGYGQKLQLSGQVDTGPDEDETLTKYRRMPVEVRRKKIADILERISPDNS